MSYKEIRTAFKQPIYKMYHKMKKELLFKWSTKMHSDPSIRNSYVQCSYHWDIKYLTEDCRVYKDFLEKLLKEGNFNEFIDVGKTQESEKHFNMVAKEDTIGIEVVHACPYVHPTCNSLCVDLQRVA